MRHSITTLIEMVVGGILLGLGLLYLISQEKAVERLIEVANEQVLREEEISEQSFAIGTNLVSDDELYAILMGYREYPIVIDGSVIPTDGADYTDYFTLIHNGVYIKSYVYDVDHDIVQIIFTYSGMQ